MKRNPPAAPPAADEIDASAPLAAVDLTPVHVQETFVGSHADELKARDPEAYAAIYGDGDVAPQIDPDEDDEQEEEDEDEQEEGFEPPLPQATKPAKPAKTGDEPMIPLARLNEVLARLDAAEARLANPAAPAAPAEPAAPVQPAPPAFDLAAKIKERNAAQWDGNEDRAVEIELEIEAYREQQATAKAIAAIKNEATVETARTEFVDVATQLTQTYPALDGTNPAKNQEAIDAVKAERDVQIAAGKSPAVALKRAVATIASEFGLEAVGTPPPANTRRGAAPPAPPINPRQVDAARMAARVANTPPNNVGGAGYGEVKDDTRPVGRDEWLGLSRAEKDKRLGIV